MSENEEPKIVVDDDWKEQVQAEKEAAAAELEQQAVQQEAMQIPPASFDLLISSLSTQALFALGLIPDPRTNQPQVDLDAAKHQIDMLSILEEKTKGNCTPEETKMLSTSLHELRMLFVEVSKNAPKADGPDDQPSSNIVMP